MKVSISNLPAELTENDLLEVFKAFGSVTSVTFVAESDGEPKGFVEMPSNTATLMAIIGLNGSELKGRKIRVRVAPESRQSVAGADPENQIKRKVA